MNSGATLTRRENEITELIAWGATYKDVSNMLFISTRTVENTVRAAKEKAGVSKVNELSAWWFCTHFHISFSLSPLRRNSLAILFLLLFIPYEFSSHQNIIRSMRVRAASCRTRSMKREDDQQSQFKIEL